MSNVLKFAALGLGCAPGPRLQDRGQVTALDSSSTSLATGASTVTADGVAIQNNQKVLYTNLSSASQNNQIYTVTGIGTQTGAAFEAQQLGEGTMPEVGDTVGVLEGSSNGNTVQSWADGSWQSISLSLGA